MKKTATTSMMWNDPLIRGLEHFHAELTAYEFRPHIHDELVVAATHGGRGKFTMRDDWDYAVPGTLLVFNPEDAHSGVVPRTAEWRYEALYVSSSLLSDIGFELSDGREWMPTLPRGLIHDEKQAQAFLTVIGLLRGTGSASERESAFLTLVDTFINRHGRRPIPVATESPIGHSVDRALELIHDEYPRDITVSELAALCGLTRFHFSRLFKERTGLSPHAYLVQVRVSRAKALLATGMRPAEAAAEVGFYDQSHLHRYFVGSYAVTPGRFMRGTAQTAERVAGGL